MFASTQAYSGFAVDDIEAARRFYGETLGIEIEVVDEEHGLISLQLAGGDRPTLVYRRDDHTPADYTIVNFPVADVEATVDALDARGVQFERYRDFEQDEKGIARGDGPTIAWFRDPAGNVLAVHEEM
jgi:catechol 2,3-dioxygenase-like lactoylglutathione lyase family enzyme